MKKHLVFLPFLALTGCAAQHQAYLDYKKQFEETVPVCVDEKDCQAKWEAAQLWIVHNSGYKLQTVTNVLLETYNPVNNSVNLSVRVTKEPLGDGKYQILAKMGCANIFGCVPNVQTASLDFNEKVGATKP